MPGAQALSSAPQDGPVSHSRCGEMGSGGARRLIQPKDFDTVVGRVAELFNMTAREILEPSKKPQRVRARSLVCFWAVRELGLVGTAVGRQMGLVQSAVSKAVERGAELAAAHDFRIEDWRK